MTLESITTEALAALVEQLDADRLPPGVVPYAVFDADETLWDGDVGNDMFYWFADNHLLHADAVEAVQAGLKALGVDAGTDSGAATSGAAASTDGSSIFDQFLKEYRGGAHQNLEAYELMVWCMAGYRSPELEAWASARIAEYLPERIYPTQKRLIERLVARGFKCYIISASNRWSVEAGGRLLGVEAPYACGVRMIERDGVLQTGLIRPAPLGPGKVEVMRTLFEGRPALACGDSIWDLPMLRTALYPILVNPRPAVLEALAGDDIRHWRRLTLPESLEHEAHAHRS